MKDKTNYFETNTKEYIRDLNRGYTFQTGDQLKIDSMGREG